MGVGEEIQRVVTLMETLPLRERRRVLEFAESLAHPETAIGAGEARRRVSAWLVSRVGHLLMGGEPRYVAGARPVWRVPVLVTRGLRGEAGFVDVDARSGELLVTDQTPQEILARVKALAGDTAPH